MADEPRRVSTRRAVLSYDQLARLTKESGFLWPDLLIKDYQGIIQDFAYTADEIDDLEVRILANEIAIEELIVRVDALVIRVDDLEVRVDDLEIRVLALEALVHKEKELTTATGTTSGNQIWTCNNTVVAVLALNPSPVDGEDVYITRKDASLTVSGTINGRASIKFLSKYDSAHLRYSEFNSEWSIL